MSKVTVILADGMRPDALESCEHPFAKQLIEMSTYCKNGSSVMPSVTLPCHMSLFHSVKPERHGTTTNIYAPQVRPVSGLCEVLKAAGKHSAMFYNWEELRDLTRPDSLGFGFYYSGHVHTYKIACAECTKQAINYINDKDPDFVFLYLGIPDWAGHTYGWLTPEYNQAIYESIEYVKQVIENTSDDRAVIFTADHGGHDRHHGLDIPEDMQIPFVFYGKEFEKGKKIEGVSLLDIAPTVAKLLDVAPNNEWEGSPIF